MDKNNLEHKNNPFDIILTLAGCLLIIIALILSKLGQSDLIVYSVFSFGVLLELVYKARMAIQHKKQGQSFIRDVVVCGVYIMMIVVVLFFR